MALKYGRGKVVFLSIIDKVEFRWKRRGQMESEVLIGVISTHAHLTALCRQIGLVQGIKLMVHEGVLESSLPGLEYFERKGVKAIVSTQGNTLFIKDHTTIPVVSVPEHKFDIFYPIARAVKQYGTNVVIFVYRKSQIDFTEISEILGFQPKVLVFNNAEHLEFLLEKIQGTDQIIIGGGFVCQVASALGFMTEAVNMSKESFVSAIEVAKGLAMAQQAERKQTYRLKAILDCTYEGIVATDESGIITLYNRAAEDIFKINAKDVIGRNCFEVLDKTKLNEVLTTKQAVIGEVTHVEDTKVVVNRVPIINDGQIVGTVASYQALQVIQDIEEKIRKELVTKNHGTKYSFADIIGHGRAISSSVDLAKRYSDCDETVLILGESGTGKELFAQSIHGISKRKRKMFIAVNCAAIPATLLESELFGYSEGSFTGARKGGKPGLFELAHGGTMFLDEIGEMPLELQAKLLRVIQEKEVRRIGGDRLVMVDIRIIAATHKDLQELIAEGKFRNDLFYRLDVLQLNVPSLFERKEDIPALAMEILNKYTDLSLKMKKVIISVVISRPDYSWPGNVRELENVIRRVAVVTKGLTENQASEKGKQMFDLHCRSKNYTFLQTEKSPHIKVFVNGSLKSIISKVEKQVIQHTLNAFGGDHSQAASQLSIGRTTLWRKLEEGDRKNNTLKSIIPKRISSKVKKINGKINISAG